MLFATLPKGMMQKNSYDFLMGGGAKKIITLPKTMTFYPEYDDSVRNVIKNVWLLLGTSLCVLDSMCPCLYVSISLCVQGSMWQISCRIDPLWLWFYVSRVLCGPGSMWDVMAYVLTF